MTRSRSWILLVVGLVLAVLTGAALYRVTSTAGGPQAPAQIAVGTVAAVVARTQIPVRTVVTAPMLVVKDLPKEAVPDSAARSETEVIGRTTLAEIPAGSLLYKAQLTAAGGNTGESIVIDPGKVLVAFPTNDPLVAAGLVSVGDRVDLLATVVSGTGENAMKTQTTVQDLEVMQVLGPTPQEPNRPRALTFVVDHQTALYLKYLRDSKAQVDVVVRSRKETNSVQTQSVNVQVLQDTFSIR